MVAVGQGSLAFKARYNDERFRVTTERRGHPLSGTRQTWLAPLSLMARSPELARLFQQPDLENHWVPMRNRALPSVMAFVAQATHPAGTLLRDRQPAA